MPAAIPDGVDRRHPAILEDAGESALRCRSGADVQTGVEGAARRGGRTVTSILRGKIPQVVDNRDARKNVGTEGIDAYGCRSEWLADCAVDFLADETEDLDEAEVWSNGLGI